MRNATLAAVAALVLFASAARAEDAPWIVDEPHGPTDEIRFTTDEATWIHLDLSPDGKTIVFSVLGDLYLLPVEGGTARRITSGPSMDVQPRFSPDGKRVAFASDRGGLENLWTCDLDGKELTQVSTEKASTVSAPAWSPDGQWLLGRKRLTDVSSLGTVELWMWHVKGGEGVRITKKEQQPDAADPVFSRDGRWIWFAARDARYRYDRNVNEGIWQLKRLDRKTGRVLPATGEFGGAAAPLPSPDGKSIAFVRRVRAKTRIEILDLATGRTRLAADDVQRDNQEGFAFHGVFPGYAWLPDGKAILATAEGKIWKFDVATGARTPVPFTAEVDQQVTKAVRQVHRVGVDDAVRIRIVRWPVESPDGKRLVFSAAGHLWTMGLPSGAPRRLTSTDDFEFSPSFSKDGSRIAYTTWNDREGGHVWTIDAAGSQPPRRVTDVPGQYVNPAFSPDGTRIVYVAGSGATFRGEDLSSELWEELRVVPASGGESRFLVGAANRGANRRMARPQWDASGERIWYVDDDPDAKPLEVPRTVLYSIQADGTDKRARLRFQRAEEARVSPDDRWVVFKELHNAWVAAIPLAGEGPVDVSLDAPAVPLAKLTDVGADWVGWTPDGSTVTWVHGPVYRRLALDKAIEGRKAWEPPKPPEEKKAKKKKAEEKPEEPKLPEAEKIEVVLTLPRAKPSGTVAYTGARVVTMRGDEVLERGTIVVKDDRIVAVGDASGTTVPEGAKVVDLSGKTVIPGLVDEHAHLHYSVLDVLPQQPWKYSANLAYGITTTHDPSAASQEVFAQSEMVDAGLMAGPRIFSTGYILYGADDPNRAIVTSLDDAKKHLERMKELGAFSVKSYMQPRRDSRQEILAAARELDMLVVPEGGGDLETNVGMILDGHTTVEHALPIAPLRKDVVTLFAKSGTSYTPTLLVAYGGLSGDKWFHQHYDLWKDERLQRFVPQSIVDTLGRIRGVMATDPADWHHIDVAASAKKVVEAGGRVCLGGHGQMQGLGPHWEIWAFVQGGMSPLQALRVATLYPAQTLGIDRDLGSLEPGKLADFVVLEKNPLEKIENSETVDLVVKNGKAYRPEDLALPKP